MRFTDFIVPGGARAPPAIAPGVAVRATMEAIMLTLADAIIAAKGQHLDRTLFEGGLGLLGDAIRGAERFVFSDGASEASARLALSKPSSLKEATKFCRIPFRHVWCEWGGYNKIWEERGEDWPASHQTIVPKRVGCLVECLDETHKRFGVTLAWEISASVAAKHYSLSVAELATKIGPCVEVSALAFVVNWHDNWPIIDRVNALNGGVSAPVFSGRWKCHQTNPSEVEAAQEIERNCLPSISPYCFKLYENAKKRGSYLDTEKLIRAYSRDWEGEYAAIIAKFCLLNSKNAVGTEPSTLERLNKSRKKQGKQPLLSHSTVTINMSRKAAASARAFGISENEIRQHIVRGHFKIRKSGVYWWSPFVRGNAEAGVVERDGYKIVADSAVASCI